METDQIPLEVKEVQQRQEKGFDNRIIEYEKVHKIEEKDFQALVSAIDPKDGDKILDGCCGYAGVSKKVLKHCKELGINPEIYLLDENDIQLSRAKENIPSINEDHIVLSDIRDTGFPDETFDTVVIKMSIHELPKAEQPKILQEVYRILKPGGKFVTWELALDEDNQKIFQDIIKKKDELAGFDLLVKNRYFPRH